jgi:hypothetical protein
MPGQPMYYAIPAKANQKLAEDFIALATSPEVQAEGHREALQLVPGHRRQEPRGQARPGGLEEALCRHHPEDLSSKGKPFPIAPYFNDILESYERKVAN